MTGIYAVVIALALVVGLLGLLVIGLLRSHGELLRRLEAAGAGLEPGHAHGSDTIHLTRSDERALGASREIAGVAPDGEPIILAPETGADPTLLAFLSTSCSSCAPFWENFDSGVRYFGGHRFRVVVVTRGENEESPTRAQSLAHGKAEVVMAEGAWDDYGVPGAPYFVLVESGTGRVVGEGSAGTFEALEEFLIDASNDQMWDRRRSGRYESDAAREMRIDDDLRQAGIPPGDPRLYPTKGDLPEGESS